ncbi:MAG TPA: hypothetical protein ENG44_02515, partial [Desulfurococcaceae archaeon]|nr:hypothetical protein [Desulfurococcaceae archaeon]
MPRMKLGRSFTRVYYSIHTFWEKHGVLLTALLVLLASGFALFVRIQPYFNVMMSGIGVTYPEARLDELDPYINYWLVNYLDKHGPFSWFELNKNNPDTCMFWFPNCRSFTNSELPGHIYTLYLGYQVAKLFGLDLMGYMSIVPPILGALTAIGIALLIFELTNSKIASILGSWVYAMMFVSRNVAGFVVKYSFGIFIAPFVIWLHLRALKRNRLIDYVLTSILLAYASTLWAGIALTAIPILITMILIPLIKDLKKDIKAKEYLMKFGIEILIPLATMLTIPYYSGKIVRGGIGLAFLGAYVLYVAGYAFHRLLSRKHALIAYATLLTAVIALGLLSIYVFHIIKPSGKIALALGIRPGGLPETVAEYQRFVNLTPDMVLLISLAVLFGVPMVL